MLEMAKLAEMRGAKIYFLVILKVWKLLYWLLQNLVQNSMLLKPSEHWYVKFSIYWSVVPTFCLHPDLWGIYQDASENLFFGIFITHSWTTSRHYWHGKFWMFQRERCLCFGSGSLGNLPKINTKRTRKTVGFGIPFTLQVCKLASVRLWSFFNSGS